MGLSLFPCSTSLSHRFGELNQHESPGAAGRVGAKLPCCSNFWQRGDFGEFCAAMSVHQQGELCQPPGSLGSRDCLHPCGSCQHHASSCQKQHQALNFPLDISPPLSSSLLQRQQPSLTHAAPRLALNYLKAQQVF